MKCIFKCESSQKSLKNANLKMCRSPLGSARPARNCDLDPSHCLFKQGLNVSIITSLKQYKPFLLSYLSEVNVSFMNSSAQVTGVSICSVFIHSMNIEAGCSGH